jgi:polyphosphate kinase
VSTDLSLFANRELSWLEFNTRVLDMARRESLPLLERLKFVAIAASNLDEFYMVRVANLRAQMGGKSSHEPSPDGRRPGEVLRDVAGRASQMCTDIAALTTDQILPALSRRGVRVLDAGALSPDQRAEASAYYQREVHPCLTPIAIDPSHPFPQLRNRSLNLALRIEPKPRARGGAIEQPEGLLFAIVQVPSVLPRFVPIACPDALYGFLPLEAVVAMHAQELFPGHKIIESCPFRVTRSSDLELVEEEAENLLTTIQDQLRRRDRREAVRLELSSSSSEELVAGLAEMIELEPLHIHRVPGLVAVGDLMAVYAAADVPELKDEPWSPVPSPALRYARSVFARLDEGDVLLHHPYESFGHVLELLGRGGVVAQAAVQQAEVGVQARRRQGALGTGALQIGLQHGDLGLRADAVGLEVLVDLRGVAAPVVQRFGGLHAAGEQRHQQGAGDHRRESLRCGGGSHHWAGFQVPASMEAASLLTASRMARSSTLPLRVAS